MHDRARCIQGDCQTCKKFQIKDQIPEEVATTITGVKQKLDEADPDMAGSMSLRQNNDFSKPFIFVLKLLILCKNKRFPFLFVLIFKSKYKVITIHFIFILPLIVIFSKAKPFNLILHFVFEHSTTNFTNQVLT
jgi:hypothetical protein